VKVVNFIEEEDFCSRTRVPARKDTSGRERSAGFSFDVMTDPAAAGVRNLLASRPFSAGCLFVHCGWQS